jgi:phosphate transport system substrate-binding protein
MNDDFLHRLRETPRPEFLAALKSRLDRQPRRRRPGFALGVLVGLIAAGTAFAFYLSTSRPRANGDFAEVDAYRPKATPLAPAWLPTHPNPKWTPPPDTASAVAVASGASPRQQTAVTATPQFQTFTFVATQQSLLSEMLSSTLSRNLRIKTPHYSIRDSLQHLCDGTGAYDFPDMVQLGRRITVEEYRTCTRNGPSSILEQKLGYQAMLLARSRLYGPLRLTARDVFLALARRVPDPSRPGELLDNPYTNWNQIDPALPYDRIKFIGPVPQTIPGKLLAELLLTAGCNTYPWIAALRDTDEGRYSEICQTLRTDGTYEGNNIDSGWAFTEALVGEPTAIGIFAGVQAPGEKLVTNTVDGVVPDMNTLASGTYPLARTLYLYLDKNRLNSSYFMDDLVLSLVSPPFSIAVGRRGSAFWAFVPLDPAERGALRQDPSRRLKELQF